MRNTGRDIEGSGIESHAVVVGASLAGIRTAQALRRGGFSGTVSIIGDEVEPPYDRTLLSTHVLAQTSFPDIPRLLPPPAAEAEGLHLLLGKRAVALDLARRRVIVTDTSEVPYDVLVIATGACSRVAPWQARSGVHVLRTLADCHALRADLALGGPVVVVGAGLTGSEVAATCRTLGHTVTLVDSAPGPMESHVGVEVGARLAALHRRHGTRTGFGAGVVAIDGTRGDLTVRLADGTELRCATAVVATGTRPNDSWLTSSGIVLTDGVECDEYGRASAPDVYAVGDVSCWYHPSLGRHLRQERATSAIEQASCVANTVLRPHALRRPRGARTARSEQYDWQVRLIGLTGPVQQHLIVDHPATASILSEPQQFTALYSEDGHSVCGAAVVNWPAAATLLRAAITDEASVDATAQALRALEVGGRLAVSG